MKRRHLRNFVSAIIAHESDFDRMMAEVEAAIDNPEHYLSRLLHVFNAGIETRSKEVEHLVTRYRIERTCIDKKSHTLEEANDVIDFFAGKGIVRYWYKCPFCNAYHTSKKESAVRLVDIV